MNGAERHAFIEAMSPDERQKAKRIFDGQIYVRALAVVQQVRRLDDSSPNAEYMADCWLLAEAVRSVVRASEICRELREGQDRVDLEDAMKRAKGLIPDAVTIRDALEHFDDYLLGVGRRHQPGESYSLTYERRPALRIHVGPWTLDAHAAALAATHLASFALAGNDVSAAGQALAKEQRDD